MKSILVYHMEALVVSTWHNTPLHRACYENDIDILQELLATSRSTCLVSLIDACDAGGWTALHVAAFQNHLEAARLLINEGANVFAVSVNGYTALHLACSRGHREMIRLLLAST